MFQRVLVAIDGSESSLWAADAAIELAALAQAELHLLSVAEEPAHYVATHEEGAREQQTALTYYAAIQAPIRERAARRGITVREAISSGHEGQAILQYIDAQQCDLLLLGHQGHSRVWGTALGSTADKIMSHALCSVLIIRARLHRPIFRHILVGLDGSPLSWQAFQIGLQVARLLQTSLQLVSVIEGPMMPSRNQEQQGAGRTTTPSGALRWDWSAYFSSIHTLAAAQAHLAAVSIESLSRRGHASGALCACAREHDSDLLVVGATGHERPWSETAGGTARRVANEAPCSVLLVRPPLAQKRVRDLMAAASPIQKQTPLAEVISRLVEQGERLLVVVDEHRHVCGVITLGSLLTHDEAFRRLDLQQVTSTQQVGAYLRGLFTTDKTAEDVFQTPLVIREDAPIESAAQWMMTHGVTRVPVLDAEERLVGVLDQANLLGYYTGLSPTADPGAAAKEEQQAKKPRIVGEARLSQVPLVPASTPFAELLHLVQETPLRRLIVIDEEGRALGVIADGDLLAARGLPARRNPLLAFAERFALLLPEELFTRRSASGLTAQQIMRPRLFSVTPGTTASKAVQLMLTHHIKRLAVVDEEGRPLGMVDRQQLLRALVEGGTQPT